MRLPKNHPLPLNSENHTSNISRGSGVFDT
jgi:hypothetical protein